MAAGDFSTYQDLLDRMDDQLADAVLAPNKAVGIKMFEAVANRRLRTWQQLTQTNLTVASGAATLPTDFIKQKSLLWTGLTPYQELKKTSWARLQSTLALTTLSYGIPNVYAFQGLSVKFAPVDTGNSTVILEYYQKIPTLVSATTSNTNWLMTAHPDLYLYGSLFAMELLGSAVKNAGTWKSLRDEVFDEIMILSAQPEEPDFIKEDCYF